MKKFPITITIATVGTLTATALGLAATAAAESAADAISRLQSQGYRVEVTGELTSSLSDCTVNSISGGVSAGGVEATGFDTVYVDVSCSGTAN